MRSIASRKGLFMRTADSGVVAIALLTSACAPDTGSDAVLQPADDRPSFVLMMGDDHGWEETGYNEHSMVQTPVLDAMAAEGLRLDRFYAAHPSCSPTRGSFLTGRHPNRYGTFAPNWSIRPEEITVAHVLGEAGYATGHFGKWHLGPVRAESPTSPGAMGFDEWVSHDNFFELNPFLSRNGQPPTRFLGEGSAIIIDETLQFIERATQAGRPFLAVVWFGSPHEPYSGLEEDLALYDDLPDRYAETTVTLTSMEDGMPTERPLRDVLRERYAEITAVDRAIGTLRDYLAAAGLRENTVVWYNGDNGTPSSGVAEQTLRGQKGSMYEGGIRVPGVVEWPRRIRAPRVSQIPVVTSDFLPTLAALSGQPLPDRPIDGINLAGLLDGTMTARPEVLFFWAFDYEGLAGRNLEPYIPPELQVGTTPLVKYMDGALTRTFQNYRYPEIDGDDRVGRRVIMDHEHKLVVECPPCPGPELFNLRDDPAETNDLAAVEPQIVERMARLLREWQQSVLTSLTGADYQ